MEKYFYKKYSGFGRGNFDISNTENGFTYVNSHLAIEATINEIYDEIIFALNECEYNLDINIDGKISNVNIGEDFTFENLKNEIEALESE